jgi:hypothetical protein
VTARRATAAIAVLVVVIEGYFLVRYLAFGALFHLYVHGLLGVGLALAGHAAWRARRPGGAGAPELLGVALAGHIASAVPDVLFLTAEIPHAAWMDVFVAHISIHFVPAPLALTFAVLAAGVAAQVARVAGAARVLALSALLAVALPAGGLAARSPLPSSIEDLRADPRIALTCALPDALG